MKTVRVVGGRRTVSSYAPGGLTRDAARREAARRGGRASGIRRRQLARARRGHAGPGQTTASLSYELQQPSRRTFRLDYERMFPRPERPCAAASWERGREAVWEHLMGSWRLVAARGQHCRTTNGQRGEHLSSRGVPRCRRSVQLYARKLEALGYAGFLHVRKPPGQRDCLSVEWRLTRRLPSSFAPPLRERRSCPTGIASPPCRQRQQPEIPPASRADDVPPDEPADRPGTEEEAIAAQIRFAQLKLKLGWGVPEELRRRIAGLEAQANPAPGCAPAPERGSDG